MHNKCCPLDFHRLFALYQCRSIHSPTKVLFYSLAVFGAGMDAQPLQVAPGIATLYGDLNLFSSIQVRACDWSLRFLQGGS